MFLGIIQFNIFMYVIQCKLRRQGYVNLYRFASLRYSLGLSKNLTMPYFRIKPNRRIRKQRLSCISSDNTIARSNIIFGPQYPFALAALSETEANSMHASSQFLEKHCKGPTSLKKNITNDTYSDH